MPQAAGNAPLLKARHLPHNGNWDLSLSLVGPGTSPADAAEAILKLALTRAEAAIKASKYAAGLLKEIAELEAVLNHHAENRTIAQQRRAQAAAARQDPDLVRSPELGKTLAVLDSEAAEASALTSQAELSLDTVRSRLKRLKADLDREQSALIQQALRQLCSEVETERFKARESFLAAAGKTLTALASAEAKIQPLADLNSLGRKVFQRLNGAEEGEQSSGPEKNKAEDDETDE